MPNTGIIEDRLQFMQIDDDVVDELRIARQLLEPELDGMLEKFYSHVLDETLLKTVFSDEKSVERARNAQKNHWLQTLLGGEFKSSYFDKAQRIGRTHARVGLTPNWYIGSYCMMLVQFIQHISVVSAEEGRDATPTIEALCKAVLLDLDLAIHCYFEAKDESMVELLRRATTFAVEMEQLNAELGVVTAQVEKSAEAISRDVKENEEYASQLANLQIQVDALTDKVKQINERVGQIRTGDRLWVPICDERTGAFAKLKALVLGD